MTKRMNALLVGAISLFLLTACTEEGANEDKATKTEKGVKTEEIKKAKEVVKENPFHNYTYELEYEDTLPNEKLKDYNYKEGVLKEIVDFDSLSDFERIELFHSDKVALEAMDFFQKPVLIETYTQKSVKYELGSVDIEFLDMAKDHNIYRMMKMGDSYEYLQSRDWESGYDYKSGEFENYRMKPEPASFTSFPYEFNMLNYFNAYKVVKESLNRNSSFIEPLGDETVQLPYDLKVTKENDEIFYKFDFLKNEEGPESYRDEFNGSWTFVFDDKMNLKRFEKQHYSSNMDFNYLMIHYRSQAESVDEAMKNILSENMYQVFKTHVDRENY